MIHYEMFYNLYQDQWFIGISEQELALNCGEHIELYITGNMIPCRLELADKWYVMMDNTSFYLRENEQYIVNL